MFTKPQRRLSRSSESWVPSGATPLAMMSKASVTADRALSSSPDLTGIEFVLLWSCAEERGLLAYGCGDGLVRIELVHDPLSLWLEYAGVCLRRDGRVAHARAASVAFLGAPRRFSAVALRARA